MNQKEKTRLCRELLRIEGDGTVFSSGEYMAWPSAQGIEFASLDGKFTADELEALAHWMRVSPYVTETETTDKQ